MNTPAPAAPDDGSVPPSSWREIFGEYGPVEGRRFHAGDRVWSVVAITPEYIARLGLEAHALLPGLANGWLSFECAGDRRRLAPIPHGWERMTAGQLSELCRQARPARRATSR